MKILVINAGSSSMKYQLIDMDTEQFIAKGNCERIGAGNGIVSYKTADGYSTEQDIDLPDHTAAFRAVMNFLTTGDHKVISDFSEIAAIGHRFAHGGPTFVAPALIDDDTLREIDKTTPLMPLHTPAQIKAVRAAQAVFGREKPMVGVFDTSFITSSAPEYAYRYAIPYEYGDKYGIRKYGFHGTSHRFVSLRINEILGRNDMKVVICHLGNGSSISAVQSGRGIDESLGLSGNGGIMMGTRSGAIDAAIPGTLMKNLGLTITEVTELLNKKSGLLGVSGVSSDMRDIHKAAEEGNERAKLAIQMLTYQIKKCIGEYAAALGGLDCVCFTGGIGENDWIVREKSCEGLEFLGIDFDSDKNRNFRGEGCMTKPGSKVQVWVIPTNEELLIARDTRDLVFGAK